MNFGGFRTGIAAISILLFAGAAFADEAVEPTPEANVVVEDKTPVKQEGSTTEEFTAPVPFAVAASSSDMTLPSWKAEQDTGKAWGAQPTLGDVTNNGAFSYSYPIAVPEFRGLEPKLALSYNSGRKTRTGGEYQGWLGYGWGLSGIPVIERAGYALGVPQYLPEDVYLLNGEPLAKCSDVTRGASCSAGGNWVSETENYLRIKFDETAKIWEITARDGTKTVLEAIGDIPGAPDAVVGDENDDVLLKYRWLVTSVTDTKRNNIRYKYNCVDAPVCYPSVISYFNRDSETTSADITFLYQERPDYILSANGHTISTTKKRLQTIVTRNFGQRTGGYKISYDQAPLSGASRLIEATQFGKDLVVDANGTIIDGTSLPKTEFDYNDTIGFGSKKIVPSIKGTPYQKNTIYTQYYYEPNRKRSVERDFWETSFSTIDADSDGKTEILKKNFDSSADINCNYSLIYRDTSDIDYTNQGIGIKCNAFLFAKPFDVFEDNNLSELAEAKTVQGLSAGRFGADKKKNQLMILAPATDWSSTAKVRWQAALTKNGNAFSADIAPATPSLT